MAQNKNNLPYFKTRPIIKEKSLANFLLRKFKPKIKNKFPQHYLVQQIPFKTLNLIKENSKKYPYFLRFDIKLYYPSIDHQILLKKLPEIYKKVIEKPLSRRFKRYLKNDLSEFLAKSPYGKGLSIASYLGYVLAGLFLLDLDWQIPRPFLRQVDDYLIFCKNKKESEILLKNLILPKLKELGLEINEKKLKSGKFYQDKVSFIGFNFYAGYFTIAEEKIEEFEKKITKITYLTKKKPKEAIIKSLNNQILGFGHYYKFANCKRTFEELDAFIRMRLRRWLLNQKELLPKEGNLILSNEILKNMGLKSLVEIKEKFSAKNKRKIKKIGKNKPKTGQFNIKGPSPQLRFDPYKSYQKLILDQLKKLTSSVEKVERRIAKIERKLEERKGPKNQGKQ